MAEENLKLQEMTLRLRNIEVKHSKQPETLKEQFKSSLDELANQKERFMAQLQQVRGDYENGTLYNVWMNCC